MDAKHPNPDEARENAQWTECAALSIKTLCKRTELSRAFIYKEIAAGHLRTEKKGRRTLIPVDQPWLNAFRGAR